MASEITPVFLNELTQYKERFAIVYAHGKKDLPINSSFYWAGVSLVIGDSESAPTLAPHIQNNEDPLVQETFAYSYQRSLRGLHALHSLLLPRDRRILGSKIEEATEKTLYSLKGEGHQLIGGYALYGQGFKAENYLGEMFISKTYAEELQSIRENVSSSKLRKYAAFALSRALPVVQGA